MPGIVRLGDVCSGHGCFPPRRGITISPNVFCESIPVHRLNDVLEPHCCPDNGCHAGIYLANKTVFSNSLSIQISGDPISCGSTSIISSGTVIVG